MSKRAAKPAKSQPQPAEPRAPFFQRGWGRLILVVATAVLPFLSFAPLSQFYLAWVGLTPWLVLIGQARSRKAAFWWSWLAGYAYFAVNLWWIVPVTVAGTLGLMVYLGFWFVPVGLVVWSMRLLHARETGETGWPALRAAGAIALIAALWTASEWVRGWLFTGLPWPFIGHSQAAILPMCQMADITGALGVSFWVALINASVAMAILDRRALRRLAPAGIGIVALTAAALGYGLWRMGQPTTSPGPSVMVVQSNFPQDNSGAKGASIEEIVLFHLSTTDRALREARGAGRLPDLVAWSETMLPEMNEVYRQAVRESKWGAFLDWTYKQSSDLAKKYGVNLLVGTSAALPDTRAAKPGKWLRMNSAIVFDRAGRELPLRYDKIHLVPFGEYIPFRDSIPLLYQFFNLFNPYEADYTITPGNDLTVFTIHPRDGAAGAGWRFVTPICFEDVDGPLVARMLRDSGGGRRADFIANLTNDGWFRINEMPQHLQIAVFRSIENRVPTARSVNTGISGFIDPVGRTYGTIEAGIAGVSTQGLVLDSRVTFYTRYGDVFAWLCAAASLAAMAAALRQWMKKPGAQRR